MKKSSLPLVSVIIPTKNEAKHIENCIKGLRFQTYPKESTEVIVVDNPGSTDGTKEIALRFTKNVFTKGPERSTQRNFGIQKAKGEIIIYLDADMTLSPTVIEKAVALMKKSSLAGLYLPEIILGNSYWSRVRRFERSFYDGTVVDCVRIIRKNIFDETGGFDPSLTGPEDWDLDKKIKKLGKVGVLSEYNFGVINKKLKKINYSADDLTDQLSRISQLPLVYHNEVSFNVKRYFQKKGYYAKSFNAYIRKWGKDDPDVKKQFGFWYRYFGIFMEKGKYKRLIENSDLTAGVFVLRVLTGVAFWLRKYSWH